MKKNITAGKILAMVSFVIIVSSCKKTDDSFSSKYRIYIDNEGAYGKLNGSVSGFNSGASATVNYLFEAVNPGKVTGDVIQSIGIANDKAYIISNNTNAVKVVSLSNFVQVAEIKIRYPRYFLQTSSETAYITSWGDTTGSVKIVDLSNSTITDSIALGNGPETLVKSGNYVYVANCGGLSPGFKQDSIISIIDINSKKVVKKIFAGKDPTNLVVDLNGDVWAICAGYYASDYSYKGEESIVKINHNSNSVEKTFVIIEKNNPANSNPFAISSDKKIIYYQGANGIYALSVNDIALPSSPFIESSVLNGISVDPQNGDIYAFTGGYTSAGTMLVFDKTGKSKKTYTVGIAPISAVFN
jgi:hypothetical protein